MSASDTELLSRLRAGDESAFEDLVAGHASALISFALTILGEIEEAEDIAQDLLLWVWERRSDFTVTGSLRTYLLTAVRRRALNVIEHRKVENRYAESGEVVSIPKLRLEDISVDDATLWNAVQALPVRWKEAVNLRYVAGQQYSEVGKILGVSESAARMLVNRAVDELRKILS